MPQDWIRSLYLQSDLFWNFQFMPLSLGSKSLSMDTFCEERRSLHRYKSRPTSFKMPTRVLLRLTSYKNQVWHWWGLHLELAIQSLAQSSISGTYLGRTDICFSITVPYNYHLSAILGGLDICSCNSFCSSWFHFGLPLRQQFHALHYYLQKEKPKNHEIKLN